MSRNGAALGSHVGDVSLLSFLEMAALFASSNVESGNAEDKLHAGGRARVGFSRLHRPLIMRTSSPGWRP